MNKETINNNTVLTSDQGTIDFTEPQTDTWNGDVQISIRAGNLLDQSYNVENPNDKGLLVQVDTDTDFVIVQQGANGKLLKLKNSGGGQTAGTGISIVDGKINVILTVDGDVAKTLLETNKYSFEPLGDPMPIINQLQYLAKLVDTIAKNVQPLLTTDNAGTNVTITGTGKDVKINATLLSSNDEYIDLKKVELKPLPLPDGKYFKW